MPHRADERHGTPPTNIQRPLLLAFFKHLYNLARLYPHIFFLDNEGSDAIHQATVFFMQWLSFGKIGGLAGPEDELGPQDLAVSLTYLCSLLNSGNNISVTFIFLA